MGAAVSFASLTSEEVAQLAEDRPKIISETIRSHELDGATVLAMDEADITSLASGLDQKKLLGAFRQLRSHLHNNNNNREIPPIALENDDVLSKNETPATTTRKDEEEDVSKKPPDTPTEEKQPTEQKTKISMISDASLLDSGCREVLKAGKYDAAWQRLSLEQRLTLTKVVKRVGLRLRDIEDALASFLFDPKNQIKDERHGQRPMLFQHDAKDAREKVLGPLRDLQQGTAKELETFVTEIVDVAFRQVPGTPPRTKRNDEEPVFTISSLPLEMMTPRVVVGGHGNGEQPIEGCFDGFDVSHVVSRDRWTERVATTMERAAKIVSAPDFYTLARDQCFVDPTDAMFLAIKIDNRDGRTTSLNWLYAEHLLISAGFHAQVADAVESLTSRRLAAVVHAKAKAGARAKEKTSPNGEYGKRTPKPATRWLKDILRCSIVFESHQAFDDGLKLILSRFASCGDPKDRRLVSPMHDVLLNVFYKDFIAEIQLHFSNVLVVKPLAHLPYEIIRTETKNLQALHLFDFPHIHLETAHRSDVKCKLSL